MDKKSAEAEYEEMLAKYNHGEISDDNLSEEEKLRREKRRESSRRAYQKRKEKGTAQKYYQKYKAQDPLYNQKAHIRRKQANNQWQTDRTVRINSYFWGMIVKFIRESELPEEELVKKLESEWWLSKRHHKSKDEAGKIVYRPHITNTTLTEKQIEELDNYALKVGLTTEHEIIKSTVSYFGDLLDVDSREEDKEVDVYTRQEIGKDYSEDGKKHKNISEPSGEKYGKIKARRNIHIC